MIYTELTKKALKAECRNRMPDMLLKVLLRFEDAVQKS